MSDKVGDFATWLERNPGWHRIDDFHARCVGTWDYADGWQSVTPGDPSR